jgi:hypothetical protein
MNIFLQDIVGVYQPTSGDVGLRCIKGVVQGFAIIVVEPVAGTLVRRGKERGDLFGLTCTVSLAM